MRSVIRLSLWAFPLALAAQILAPVLYPPPFVWFVDPSAGNDGNSCQATTVPCLTFNAVAGKVGYALGQKIALKENGAWKEGEPVALGLLGDYRASSITGLAQDTAIGTTWNDASGNGYNATQATAALQPHVNFFTTFKQQALRFGGNGQTWVSLPAGLSMTEHSFTMIVFQERVTGQQQYVLVNDTAGMYTNTDSTTTPNDPAGRLGIYDGTGNGASSTSQPPVFYRPNMIGWGGGVSGHGILMTRNVLTDTGFALNTKTFASNNLGFTPNVAGSGTNNNMYEVMFFNRLITQAEANQLLSYGRRNYGIPSTTTTKQVWTAGDSLTSASPAQLNGLGWVQQASIATASSPWTAWGNIAISGLGSGALRNPDIYYKAGFAKNILTLWIGTNDLNVIANATILSNIASWVAARRATGWQIITLTITPKPGGATPEADRQVVNAALVANAGGIYGDIIADVGSDPTIGLVGENTNLTYYLSDQLHLNSTGNAIVTNTYVLPALSTIGFP